MLKEMLKRCQKQKKIIVEYWGEQKFLSDGLMMAYIGDVAPFWTCEDCAVALELTDDDREAYDMEDRKKENAYEGIDYTKCEKVSALRYSINIDSTPVQPFMLESGEVVFINMQQMRVFRDEYPKAYYFDADNIIPKVYIVVNEKVIGAITPLRVELQKMKEFCTELSDGIKKSAKRGLFGMEEQISLFDEEE